MMNGEFESTSNELTGKIYGQKARTVIDHLEARHRVHSPTMAMRASCARAACSARPVRGFSTASTEVLRRLTDHGERLPATAPLRELIEETCESLGVLAGYFAGGRAEDSDELFQQAQRR